MASTETVTASGASAEPCGRETGRAFELPALPAARAAIALAPRADLLDRRDVLLEQPALDQPLTLMAMFGW